jgi:hypothetical protein
MSDYDLKEAFTRAAKQQASLYETKCHHTDLGTNKAPGRLTRWEVRKGQKWEDMDEIREEMSKRGILQ